MATLCAFDEIFGRFLIKAMSGNTFKAPLRATTLTKDGKVLFFGKMDVANFGLSLKSYENASMTLIGVVAKRGTNTE